jgi:arylsulfatase A-like enzyme
VGFDHYYGFVANLPAAPHGFIEDDEISDPFPSVPLAPAATESAKGRTAWQVDHVMATLTSKLTGWIEADQTQPFFVYFAPNAVHEPVAPNARYTGSPYGKYGDFISELDGSVGQILATLDRLKLADNTIVIFTSDNGGVIEAHNENSVVARKAGLVINGPWRGGKHSEWEGGFREPFIVRWPGQVPADTVSDQVICLTDLLATFAHVLRAPLRPGQAEDSFNVLRAFTERQPGAPVRGPVILQSADGTYNLRMGDWKLVERVKAPTFSTDRNKRTIAAAKKKQAAAFPRDELYNLKADPFETRDEWPTHQDRAAAMKKILGESRNRGFTRLPAEARVEDILPAVTQP